MDMDEYILKNVMKILSWIVKCKNVKCHIELSCKVLLDMYRFRIYRWQKACKQVKCLFPLIRRYCKKWGNDNDWIGTQTRDLCYSSWTLVRNIWRFPHFFNDFDIHARKTSEQAPLRKIKICRLHFILGLILNIYNLNQMFQSQL